MKAEEFRPLDLPDGWTISPETDSRHWITKATETQYYDYVANNQYRVRYFIDALDSFESSDKQKQLARIVQKNHLFVNEPIYTAELDSKAKSMSLTSVRDTTFRYMLTQPLEALFYPS